MNENRLMHDGQKTKNCSFIVYAEHIEQETLDELLEDMGVKCWRSPLHDKDVYDKASVHKWERSHKNPTPEELERKPKVGQTKKPHWHVGLEMSGPRGKAYILGMIPDELCVTTLWKEPDVEHAKRYGCHLDSKTKVKYDIADEVSFGGCDLSCLEQLSENDKANDIAYICNYIKKNKCTNFFDLSNWVMSEGDYQLFKALVARTAFFTNYMHGMIAKLDAERNK